jgi:hypothetical protein
MFQDNLGTNFTTNHGQAPQGPQNVTIHNNGNTSPGFWNGSQVVRY